MGFKTIELEDLLDREVGSEAGQLEIGLYGLVEPKMDRAAEFAFIINR